MMQTFSTKCDWREIDSALGERFEIAYNTYKPFACGVVIHPCIDGCIDLAAAHRLTPDDIARVSLRVHPPVLDTVGGPLTVNYSKAGLISAQRQLNVPWKDFALAPDVVLIPFDTRSTFIDASSFPGSTLTPIQVARGTPMTDSDGTQITFAKAF